mgnify:CR=1 FL=1
MQTRLVQNGADEEETDMPLNWQEGVDAYQRILQEQKLLDFDDLLLETLSGWNREGAQDGWEKGFFLSACR